MRRAWWRFGNAKILSLEFIGAIGLLTYVGMRVTGFGMSSYSYREERFWFALTNAVFVVALPALLVAATLYGRQFGTIILNKKSILEGRQRFSCDAAIRRVRLCVWLFLFVGLLLVYGDWGERCASEYPSRICNSRLFLAYMLFDRTRPSRQEIDEATVEEMSEFAQALNSRLPSENSGSSDTLIRVEAQDKTLTFVWLARGVDAPLDASLVLRNVKPRAISEACAGPMRDWLVKRRIVIQRRYVTSAGLEVAFFMIRPNDCFTIARMQ